MKTRILKAADAYAAAVRDQALGGADAAPARMALEDLLTIAFGSVAEIETVIRPLPPETAPAP